ncbi:MAG TPA: DUF2993 domain-containing protein [Candidatus Corynebacterium gallistercoris]|uniref:DUF2993 domain-containing protein n=1 Tax=Candidatus Corynebacterium gallistercoris TaxID=2838530 RepID=A0A9D1UPJ9_9CORY|nr:DUF2993 domain-containing protein [Candidatus Corynebacterium gallistercoris]
MTNPYETRPLDSHPAGSNVQQNQPSFGSPPTKAEAKKSGKGWKIALAIVAVLAILLVAGEVGMRADMSSQITSSVKQEAADSGLTLERDPEVSFGPQPVLLGLVSGSIPHMDMNIPSTLDISFEDGDASRPVVEGNPPVHLVADDLKTDGSSDNITMGEVTITTTIPKELMLAQAQKGTDSNQDPQGAQGGTDLGFLEGLFRVTGIEPNLERQAMEFQIGGGIAKLRLKPVVDGSTLRFEVDSAEFLSFEVPESFVNSIKGSLEDAAVQGIGGGLEFQSVSVTQDGMEIVLHGTDVDMKEVGQTIETGSGDSSTGYGA